MYLEMTQIKCELSLCKHSSWIPKHYLIEYYLSLNTSQIQTSFKWLCRLIGLFQESVVNKTDKHCHLMMYRVCITYIMEMKVNTQISKQSYSSSYFKWLCRLVCLFQELVFNKTDKHCHLMMYRVCITYIMEMKVNTQTSKQSYSSSCYSIQIKLVWYIWTIQR